MFLLLATPGKGGAVQDSCKVFPRLAFQRLTRLVSCISYHTVGLTHMGQRSVHNHVTEVPKRSVRYLVIEVPKKIVHYHVTEEPQRSVQCTLSYHRGATEECTLDQWNLCCVLWLNKWQDELSSPKLSSLNWGWVKLRLSWGWDAVEIEMRLRLASIWTSL